MHTVSLPYFQLKQAYEELLVRFEKLEAEVVLLRAENARLIQENKELKDKLGLNSKNSGIPSSKELYKLKRVKAKSSRKAGGQPGHKANFRALGQADEVVNVSLSDQCDCEARIEKSEKPYVFQKIEI